MSKLNRIDVVGEGILHIRFIKDDGGYHRTIILPDTDVDRQMNEVDAHLITMRQTRVPATERTAIKDIQRVVKDTVSKRVLK